MSCGCETGSGWTCRAAISAALGATSGRRLAAAQGMATQQHNCPVPMDCIPCGAAAHPHLAGAISVPTGAEWQAPVRPTPDHACPHAYGHQPEPSPPWLMFTSVHPLAPRSPAPQRVFYFLGRTNLSESDTHTDPPLPPRSVVFNFLGRDFFTALSEKDEAAFKIQLVKYLAGFALGIPVFVIKSYYQVGQAGGVHGCLWVPDGSSEVPQATETNCWVSVPGPVGVAPSVMCSRHGAKCALPVILLLCYLAVHRTCPDSPTSFTSMQRQLDGTGALLLVHPARGPPIPYTPLANSPAPPEHAALCLPKHFTASSRSTRTPRASWRWSGGSG